MVSLLEFLEKVSRRPEAIEKEAILDKEYEEGEERKSPTQGARGWSILARRVARMNRERYGYTQAIIYGVQGAGKSTYAIKVARDYLWFRGARTCSYDYILREVIVFDLDTLLKRIGNASWERRLYVQVWDDAGIHASSYFFFLDKWRVKEISDLVQTIRSRLEFLLITTTKPQNLVKALREVESFIVHVEPLATRRSRATGYKLKLLPSGKFVVLKSFVEYFDPWLPNHVYRSYMKMRDSYVDQALKMAEIGRRISEAKKLEKLVRLAKELEKLDIPEEEKRVLIDSLLRRLKEP